MRPAGSVKWLPGLRRWIVSVPRSWKYCWMAPVLVPFWENRGCRVRSSLSPRLKYTFCGVLGQLAVCTQSTRPGYQREPETNFDAFRAIHQSDPETYWNAGRMLQALDEWLIYLLYRDDSPVGYVCSRNREIFDLGFRDDQFDAAVFAILITVVLRDLQAAGYCHMIFFVDDEKDEERQNAVLSLGFTCVTKLEKSLPPPPDLLERAKGHN